jgi:hypothetical protein
MKVTDRFWTLIVFKVTELREGADVGSTTKLYDYFDFVEKNTKRWPNENFTACTGSHALDMCEVSSQFIALSPSNWVGRGRGFYFFIVVKLMLEGCKFIGTYFSLWSTCVPSLKRVAFFLTEKIFFSKISVLNFFLEKIHNEDPLKNVYIRHANGAYMRVKIGDDRLRSSHKKLIWRKLDFNSLSPQKRPWMAQKSLWNTCNHAQHVCQVWRLWL